MKKNKITAICAYWEQHSVEDISTERLLEMTRSQFDLDDVSDVVDALVQGDVLEEVKTGAV